MKTSGRPTIPQKQQSYFATITSLVHLVWQASPIFLVVAVSLMLIVGLLPLVSIFLTSTLLDSLVQAVPSTSGRLDVPTHFILLLLLLVASRFLQQFLQNFASTVQLLLQTRVNNHIQLLVSRKAATIDLAYFETSEFHNQMRTAANEAAYRPMVFLNQMMQVISILVTLVSLAVVILLWKLWVIPVICLAMLAKLYVSMRIGSARFQLITQRAETERKKLYMNMLLISDQPAKEIRLFGLQDFLIGRLRTLLEQTYLQDLNLAKATLICSSGASAIETLTQMLLFAFAVVQVLGGLLTIGQFNLYTQSMLQIENAIIQFTQLFGEMHQNHLFAINLFNFLGAKSSVEKQRPESKSRLPRISSLPQIEFSHVSFQYPGVDRWVLKDVSFVIHPNEIVALVGENGAGKTTLVKLLTGLYEPSSGTITLDGIDIRELDRRELRAYLSVIFQDFSVYHFSAYENVAIGQVNWMNDFVRVQLAVQRSGLDHVISKLPEGYNTVLGRSWENGHELSGGQRQLVALARSLLRNAPILILDEPSASLDIYTERHFFQRLMEEHPTDHPQTVIFISHRFATVRRANRILVLEQGQLIECGSHEELIGHGGRYAEMFALQAEAYNRNSSNGDNVPIDVASINLVNGVP